MFDILSQAKYFLLPVTRYNNPQKLKSYLVVKGQITVFKQKFSITFS